MGLRDNRDKRSVLLLLSFERYELGNSHLDDSYGSFERSEEKVIVEANDMQWRKSLRRTFQELLMEDD